MSEIESLQSKINLYRNRIELLEKKNEFLLNMLSSVVEYRNMDNSEHVNRVKDLSKILAKSVMIHFPEFQLNNERVQLIAEASAFHDLGKIAIPDSILLKPGKLTMEEFDEMKKHPIYGCEILKKFNQTDSEFYTYCYNICRYHHERVDGSGYPDGLKGDEVPISAQIVCLVDIYDALISERSYGIPYDIYEAARMILEGECGPFSDEILKAFEYCLKDFYDIAER